MYTFIEREDGDGWCLDDENGNYVMGAQIFKDGIRVTNWLPIQNGMLGYNMLDNVFGATITRKTYDTLKLWAQHFSNTVDINEFLKKVEG